MAPTRSAIAVLIGAVIIGGDQIERTVALGLDGQPPVQLERGSQQGPQGHHFSRHPRRRLRQDMSPQGPCRGGIQADKTAAHTRLCDIERQDEVAIRRRMRIHFVRHDGLYGADARQFNPDAAP